MFIEYPLSIYTYNVYETIIVPKVKNIIQGMYGPSKTFNRKFKIADGYLILHLQNKRTNAPFFI